MFSNLNYWSPEQVAETISIPYLLLVVYFITCAFSIANYVAYFRFEEDIYGSNVLRAYIAFVIIGCATYILFSGMMWLWAAKYSPTASVRGRRLSHGVWAIFIFKDLPLFIIEYHALLCCGGMRDSYQGFVFVVQFIVALCSFAFTWLSFTWRMASFCQYYFGGGLVEEGLKTGQEKVNIFGSSPPGGLPYDGPSPTAFQRPQQQLQHPSLHSMQDYSPPNSPSNGWGPRSHPPTPQPMNTAAEAFARDYDIPTPNRNGSPRGPRTLTRGDSLPPRRLPLNRPWEQPDSSQRSPRRDTASGPRYNDEEEEYFSNPNNNSGMDPSPNWRWGQHSSQHPTPRESNYGSPQYGSPMMTVERTVI